LKPNDGVIISSFIFDVLLFPSEILDIMLLDRTDANEFHVFEAQQ